MSRENPASDGEIGGDFPIVFPPRRLWEPVLLALVAGILAFGGIVDRPILYDEAISLLVTSGQADPGWPEEVVPAQELLDRLEKLASLGRIADDLRRTDVHPPLYFWALSLWQRVYGASLETGRLFSAVTVILVAWVLWVWLYLARCPRPFWAALAFVLSSGVIFASQTARPYALALLWTCAAAAVAHLATGPPAGAAVGRSWAAALALGVVGWLAVCTHYLAIAPVAAILLFSMLRLGRVSKPRALAAPGLFAALAAVGLPYVLGQTGARPLQEAGFVGWGEQLRDLAHGYPASVADVSADWQIAVLLAVVAGAVYATIRARRRIDRPLVLLLGLMAVAPGAGIAILNLVFDKHLGDPRYLVFAVPGLAVLLAYGPLHVRGGRLLLLALFALQLLNVPRTGAPGGPVVPTATERFRPASPESVLAVIGAGFGRAAPVAALHDLDPRISVLVLDEARDLEILEAVLPEFSDVLLIRANDRQTESLEEAAKEKILRSSNGSRPASRGGDGAAGGLG